MSLVQANQRLGPPPAGPPARAKRGHGLAGSHLGHRPQEATRDTAAKVSYWYDTLDVAPPPAGHRKHRHLVNFVGRLTKFSPTPPAGPPEAPPRATASRATASTRAWRGHGLARQHHRKPPPGPARQGHHRLARLGHRRPQAHRPTTAARAWPFRTILDIY
jgi:hypothetical protein